MSKIERKNFGIFGRVNVGKSTLMNLLTESFVSLVDKKRGTTADVKTAFMEIHGLGPIKIFDTPGLDEKGGLGEKKKERAFLALKECDLVFLIINSFSKDDLSFEKAILDMATARKKKLFLLFNIFNKKIFFSSEKKVKEVANYLNVKNYFFADFLNKDSKKLILDYILENFNFEKQKVELFSDLKKGDVVFLNIPLDDESPEGRLLRPQALVQEKLLRKYVATFAYRMDLKKARSKDINEYSRFMEALALNKSNLKLLITDSSAIDIVHKWTMKDKKEIVPITTFSIIMAHLTSGGRIKDFVKGLSVLNSLKKGDKILIAESCTHNRIAEDIGEVQIPNLIKKVYGEGIIIEHLFGKEFLLDNLKSYKLVIHCGGCMLDSQKLQSRLEDLKESKVAFTNYGVFLSFMQSKEALKRVIKPF